MDDESFGEICYKAINQPLKERWASLTKPKGVMLLSGAMIMGGSLPIKDGSERRTESMRGLPERGDQDG